MNTQAPKLIVKLPNEDALPKNAQGLLLRFRMALKSIENGDSARRNQWATDIRAAGLGSDVLNPSDFALHYAVAAECPQLIAAILKQDERANPGELKNEDGKTALVLADASSELSSELKMALHTRATLCEADRNKPKETAAENQSPRVVIEGATISAVLGNNAGTQLAEFLKRMETTKARF